MANNPFGTQYKKFSQKKFRMFFPSLAKRCSVSVRTGKLSNTSSIGKVAKMFRSEVLEKNQKFNFYAFGDNLIGRTIKAFSIAQNSEFDNAITQLPKDHKLQFIALHYETPSKRRSEIPSIRFVISSGTRQAKDNLKETILKISSTTISDDLAARIHHLYLNQAKDSFILRCVGDNQASIVVQALAKFNEHVDSHKLSAWISNELIHDTRKVEGRMLRVIQFNIDVVGKDLVFTP